MPSATKTVSPSAEAFIASWMVGWSSGTLIIWPYEQIDKIIKNYDNIKKEFIDFIPKALERFDVRRSAFQIERLIEEAVRNE